MLALYCTECAESFEVSQENPLALPEGWTWEGKLLKCPEHNPARAVTAARALRDILASLREQESHVPIRLIDRAVRALEREELAVEVLESGWINLHNFLRDFRRPQRDMVKTNPLVKITQLQLKEVLKLLGREVEDEPV